MWFVSRSTSRTRKDKWDSARQLTKPNFSYKKSIPERKTTGTREEMPWIALVNKARTCPWRRNAGWVSTPAIPSAGIATAPKRCRKERIVRSLMGSSTPACQREHSRMGRLRAVRPVSSVYFKPDARVSSNSNFLFICSSFLTQNSITRASPIVRYCIFYTTQERNRNSDQYTELIICIPAEFKTLVLPCYIMP